MQYIAVRFSVSWSEMHLGYYHPSLKYYSTLTHLYPLALFSFLFFLFLLFFFHSHSLFNNPMDTFSSSCSIWLFRLATFHSLRHRRRKMTFLVANNFLFFFRFFSFCIMMARVLALDNYKNKYLSLINWVIFRLNIANRKFAKHDI